MNTTMDIFWFLFLAGCFGFIGGVIKEEWDSKHKKA
jgi:hypothetical protein